MKGTSEMSILVIIVCFIAILCFFSQEIIGGIKKIFAIRGAKMLLPLALASYISFYYTPLLLWILYYIHERLLVILHILSSLIPYKEEAYTIAAVLLLTLISIGPVALLNIYLYKKTHKFYAHPYWLSTFLWLISVMLLLLL